MTINSPILITGGTGMVGSHIAARLLENTSHDIIIPVRESSSVEYLRTRTGHYNASGRLRIITTDYSSENHFRTLFNGVGTVIHCAARISVDNRGDQEIISGNVRLARNVTDACIAAGVRKIINISSIAALSTATERTTNETHLPGSEESLTDYGKAKFLSDREVERARIHGIVTHTLFPATIIGPADAPSPSALITKVLSRRIGIYPTGSIAFVDVEDVAGAVCMLAGREDLPGENFLLSSQNVTYRRLIESAMKLNGYPLPRIGLGIRMLSIAGGLERIVSRLTGRKAMLTPQVIKYLTGAQNYDGGKLTRITGMRYRTAEDSLKIYLKK